MKASKLSFVTLGHLVEHSMTASSVPHYTQHVTMQQNYCVGFRFIEVLPLYGKQPTFYHIIQLSAQLYFDKSTLQKRKTMQNTILQIDNLPKKRID